MIDIERNKQEGREQIQRLKDARKLSARKSTIKKKYGINYDEFMRMLELANHKCEVCGRDVVIEGPRGSANLAHIDHCHDTGRVRGVLCFKCNTGIGALGDTICSVLKAVEYLRKTPLREI